MSVIANRTELLEHGNRRRTDALEIAEYALASVDPYRAAKQIIAFQDDVLTVQDQQYTLDHSRRLFILGAGKASYPIARALDEVAGPRIQQGIVVCKYGHRGSLGHIRVLSAAHPIPDENSLAAACAGKSLISEVGADDIVVTCFTGGSSALFAEPVECVSLADKAEASRILLTCGADIREINSVRKAISKVKGGRLIQSLPPGATVISLTVSDVTGDPLEFITDLTVPNTSTVDDARHMLNKYDLWNRMPVSISQYLQDSRTKECASESDLAHINRQDVLLIAGDVACTAAAEHAQTLGYDPLILSSQFEGESKELANAFASIAKEIHEFSRPLSAPCALIGGGETTVSINPHETYGQGGPNQVFVLALAENLADTLSYVGLGLDTDGTDGPTDAAGGIVDNTTSQLALECGVHINQSIRQHNAYEALTRLGGLIVTGNTDTNVNDLKLLLID